MERQVTRAQLEQTARFNRRMEPPVLVWCADWPRRSWSDALPWLGMLLPWALLVAGVVWR